MRYRTDLWTDFYESIYDSVDPVASLSNPPDLSKLPTMNKLRRNVSSHPGKFIDFSKNHILNSGFIPID